MAKVSQILLIEDVDHLGKSGDIVKVKPGYARNWILPQKKGITATKQALRLREKLQEERRARAVIDLAESEALAAKLEGLVISIAVKVDPDGHMYGSVSAGDIVGILTADHKLPIERRNLQMVHPIKEIGEKTIVVKLKEGVEGSFLVRIVRE
jgi:large subunit ribosomal protein L9